VSHSLGPDETLSKLGSHPDPSWLQMVVVDCIAGNIGGAKMWRNI